VTETDDVFVDVLVNNSSVSHGSFKLEQFMKTLDSRPFALSNGTLWINTKYIIKNTKEEEAVKNAAVKPAASMEHPQNALASEEVIRPWFMRVSSYYDMTKDIYKYTTSFRLVSTIARIGENSANTVLQKVTGKDLQDVDQRIVPLLNNLDDRVDETITSVLSQLVKGQMYVLKTKNHVVEKASDVSKTTYETVQNAVGTTLTSVASAKDYTQQQVSTVSSNAISSVIAAKDYTTKQVTNVSCSAYQNVRGAATYLISHVPYVGAKIRVA
jgi:hypothetical protein